MRKALILIAVLLGLSAVYSLETVGNLHRQTGTVDDSYIVRTKGSVNCEDLEQLIRDINFRVEKELVPSLNICLVRSIEGISSEAALDRLQGREYVRYAQSDHEITLREVIPDDPEFSKLWSFKQEALGHVSVTEAWELGTGGKDRFGKDLVVAVVDSGLDLTHQDLVGNIWFNTNEIPDNDIDDDENGYVDDINGWNAYTDSGTISSSSHGTHVAGTIGAKGNNGLQISGLNWDIKIMAVPASSRTTSVIVTGYGYVLAQKKLWLETEGQKGANVVSTNSSFGVDRGNCISGDFPVWNDLYTEMGKVGILSAAATANSDWNIDVVGDVPTGCSSDFIIAVTNTTNQNKKYSRAGYGQTTVDLGAPGTSVVSTIPTNRVSTKTGTSMATPHVAGAVALLHNVASEDFAQLYQDNPEEGALVIKNILMQTVDPLADLEGKTVSGGRLNLGAAAKAISEFKVD